MPSPTPRATPSILGPFRLLRPLGHGGFAPVWLAEELYGGKKLRAQALLPARRGRASFAGRGRDDVFTGLVKPSRRLQSVDSSLHLLHSCAQPKRGRGSFERLDSRQTLLHPFERSPKDERPHHFELHLSAYFGIGDPMLRGVALSLRAHALCVTGHLEEALSCAKEAELLQRERNDRMRAQTLLRLAEIRHALGKTNAAYDDARAARQAAEEHGDKGFAVTAALWEALHLAQQGRATKEDLVQAMSDVERAGVGQRALARSLMERSAEWLGWRTQPAP
jgi:hypothetical protein